MPLHTETMYGHSSAETVTCPVRSATGGSFTVLDVRQRVPNISGKYRNDYIIYQRPKTAGIVIKEI